MKAREQFKEKLLGGLYGLLIGDAVGMPYEFKAPHRIPPLNEIEMISPLNFDRSWKNIPFGSYTDDGSQALCLLEYYTEQEQGDDWSRKWADKLLKWYYEAHLWVDNRSFDAGIQTREVIGKLKAGTAPLEAANPHDVMQNGNGSLMRALPTALWHVLKTPLDDIMQESINISRVTHAHARSTYSCAFYNAIAVSLLVGDTFEQSLEAAMYYMKTSPQFDQGEWSVIAEGEKKELHGSGYVVDSLWTAIECIRATTSYADCIKRCIWYGKDTDTTACIAGGLAGIIYGRSGIPAHWFSGLKGKEMVTPLAQKLLEHHGVV